MPLDADYPGNVGSAVPVVAGFARQETGQPSPDDPGQQSSVGELTA
jgi:hypothetical protein